MIGRSDIMSLSIKVITFPCFSANCYLVTDSQTGESLLIDPGSYGERQREYIKAQGVEKLRYILLTHGHYDHMLGTEKFRDAFGGEVAVHSADEEKLSSEMKSLFSFGGDGRAFASAKADIILSDGDRLPFGKGEIEVLHTPGHTKGGVCYIIGDVMFTGDTLFRGTIGRTDFPDSDEMEMLESLIKLDKLTDDYKIYPGHELTSTLSYEKQTNKYMKLAHRRGI